MDGLIALVYARKLYDLAEGPQGPPGQDGEVTNAALEEKLEAYAKLDGVYPNFTAGNALQLVSNVRVNDQTPYVFRTSGGSVDIGDREYVNGIVGGTVAWNQQVYNGDFSRGDDTGWSNTSTWKSYSVSDGTLHLVSNANQTAVTYISTEVKNIVNHVYLLSLSIKSSKATEFSGAVGGVSGGGAFRTTPYSANVWTHIGGISKVHTFTYNTLYLRPKTTEDAEEVSIDLKNVMLFDLTQMFGSTIADYIYTLETATAGAGVAWFKKLFNKPYYAYNAGELKSVSGLVSHDMTGFNQFDKSTAEVGGLSGDGTKSSNTNYKISQYIECVPNTTYYFKNVASNYNSHSVGWYDANKNFIQYNDFQGTATADEKSGTKTSPSNARYMRVACYKDAIDRVNVNISWDGSRDGEYEPYELHSYPLDSSVVLRGIPKLDANNELYYDGDVYEADGTVTRKYGIAELSELAWISQAYDGVNYFFAKADIAYTKNSQASVFGYCTLYPVVSTYGGGLPTSDKTITFDSLYYGAGYSIVVRDASISTVNELKTALTGKGGVIYALATPTTEQADPYQQVQICNDFGTEEYVLDDSAFPVPVGHDTEYPVNLVAKLEMAPNSPGGDGDYIVRQTNGMNEYVPLVIEDALPTMPSTAGTYKLTVTVADGSDPVLSWEAE